MGATSSGPQRSRSTLAAAATAAFSPTSDDSTSPKAYPPDLSTQLSKLTQLHQAGAITDDEFAAADARLLA